MTTFDIPDYTLSQFKDKIDILNRKAIKLHLPLISYQIVNEEIHKYCNIDMGFDINRPFIYKTYSIELSGISPKINGWEFLAKIEHTENGNIISKMSTVDLSESYRTIESKCEHCHIDRKRNFTFIIQSENGELKQVGSSCLIDFMGHRDAKSIAEFYASISVEWFLSGYNNSDSEEEEFKIKRGKLLFSIIHYLVYVNRSIKENGWISASHKENESEWMQGHPTKYSAFDNMMDKKYIIPESDFITESEIIKNILSVVSDNLAHKPVLSDYESNLSILIKNEYISYNQMGYVASIIPFYKRIIEDQIKIKTNKQFLESHHIGTIGEKLTNLSVKLLSNNEIESQFGVINVYNFIDNSGNKLTWFSSRDLKLTVGNDYIIDKCTVKDHSEYKGIKQTIITRAKLQ